MQGIIHFETFLLSGILLNITPGNDTIFILTKSISQGKKAGIISALGIGTGSIIHTLLAACGLSLIIAKSILLFNIIKFAGALYLIYIGYKMFTGNMLFRSSSLSEKAAVNYWKIYRSAIVTNVLNPKVALFFIAFLPQFINVNIKETFVPFMLLGLTFITTGTLWCLVIASFASAIFAKLAFNKKLSAFINKFCGIALVALGIKVAFSNKS